MRLRFCRQLHRNAPYRPPATIRSADRNSCAGNVWFPGKTVGRTGLRSLACSIAMACTEQKRADEKISLTEIENKIFSKLISVADHFNLQTELRVAGGWVRDKLLGKKSCDIDIAINNMLGSEFVNKVAEYLLSIGEKVQGMCVIPCKPDQSKHLETARLRFFDLWIDFVNLRCEEYCENSRIPTMKFGTAKEDAYRRDLTINSLFYNINTGEVEDFTGRGIADLKSGKIMTPLPPMATFLDDPLRILRAIRFAARFGFTLDEELKKAGSNDHVKDALAVKISRERIGTEIDLMMAGNQPVTAISHIIDMNLFWATFGIPSNVEPRLSELEGCDRLCIACMDVAWNLIQLIGYSSFTDEQRRICLYAALFIPFQIAHYQNEKGKEVSIINFILKVSLKQRATDPEMVLKIHRSFKKFMEIIPFLISHENVHLPHVDWGLQYLRISIESEVRVFAGSLLREMKDLWRIALLVSIICYPAGVNSIQDLSEQKLSLPMRAELFKEVEDAIIKLGLGKIWEEKPLVDGIKIIEVLELQIGGPIVKEWQQRLLAWQLAHPSGTADECLEWMHEMHSKRAKIAHS